MVVIIVMAELTSISAISFLKLTGPISLEVVVEFAGIISSLENSTSGIFLLARAKIVGDVAGSRGNNLFDISIAFGRENSLCSSKSIGNYAHTGASTAPSLS